MANETTIKIKMTPDGNDYTIELVEKDAMNGTRKDQLVAQGIMAFEQMSRDENFNRAWGQFKQQVQMQQQMQQQPPPQSVMYGQPYGNPYSGAPIPPQMYGGNPYGGMGWGGGFRR